MRLGGGSQPKTLRPPFACESPPPLFEHPRKGRASGAAFEPARLIIEALQCGKLLLTAEPGLRNRRFQNSDRLVVDRDRHWEGMPVLAAMSHRKPRRVSKVCCQDKRSAPEARRLPRQWPGICRSGCSRRVRISALCLRRGVGASGSHRPQCRLDLLRICIGPVVGRSKSYRAIKRGRQKRLCDVALHRHGNFDQPYSARGNHGFRQPL